MLVSNHVIHSQGPQRGLGFTLVETVISMLVLSIIAVGVIKGYMETHRVSEWSSYSLTAQSLASQSIEQTRCAKWDPNAWPPVDQVVESNFPVSRYILDVPISGTNVVWATNRTTIRTVSTTPPLKKISVECTWPFANKRVCTNTILTYRAPDQ